MGANMARRLVDCGHTVSVVQDMRDEVARDLAEELGAAASPDLSSVTAGADIIFTVVTDDAAMREIFTGETLLKDANGKIFINCATVSPEVHEEIGIACRKAGAQALEACMASSIPQARDGSLYLMVGGVEETFNQVEPLLKDGEARGKQLEAFTEIRTRFTRERFERAAADKLLEVIG